MIHRSAPVTLAGTPYRLYLSFATARRLGCTQLADLNAILSGLFVRGEGGQIVDVNLDTLERIFSAGLHTECDGKLVHAGLNQSDVRELIADYVSAAEFQGRGVMELALVIAEAVAAGGVLPPQSDEQEAPAAADADPTKPRSRSGASKSSAPAQA